jgi:hypothetical protein
MDNFERRESGLLVPVDASARFGGRFIGKIVREGEVIDEFDVPNLVVNEGLNHILGVELGGVTQITSWFLGLFQGNYTPQASDTAANIASNSTECSSYTSPTRLAWAPAAAASQRITNGATPATFTFNGAVTVYGGFLISNNTIAGTGGILLAETLFTAPKSVVDDDQLLLTYAIGAASA